MEKKPYPSETQERFIVRFPDGMRDRITEEAKKNNRSMNAEIVARLERSFEDSGDKDDRELETAVTLNAVRDALVEIVGKANVHEDATRAMGRDLYALCREALPIIEDDGQVRAIMHKLGDVGSAMQADDLADAQGRLRALFYLAMEYAGRDPDVPVAD